MRKYILIFGIILTVIGGYVFSTSRPKQEAPSNPPKVERPIQSKNDVPPKKQLNFKQMMAEVFTEEEFADPEIQKAMLLFDTPEYQAFLETNPTSLNDVLDFYEAQGIQFDRNEIHEPFRKVYQQYFTSENVDTLEQQMQQELSDILSESNIEFQQAIRDFVSKEQNIAWIMQHFQGDYFKFGEWAVNVRDRLEISKIIENDENFIPVQPPTETSIPDDTLVSDTPIVSTDIPDEHEKLQSALEDSQTQIEGTQDLDLDMEITELLGQTLPEQPELPTQATIEKSLRDSFSPKQINTAMQTLNRYGPEEGLRRLRESDPLIAKQLERIIEKNKDNN